METSSIGDSAADDTETIVVDSKAAENQWLHRISTRLNGN